MWAPMQLGKGSEIPGRLTRAHGSATMIQVRLENGKVIMPLLDHFHPPLSAERRWESFHSSWATRIADGLTECWLPPNYIAEEHAHLGPSVEIDVATFEQEAPATGPEGAGVVATVGTKVWVP